MTPALERATFLPSRHAFQFTNSWPSQPAVRMETAFGRIEVGNAKAGLCGGMVFAALDYWRAGREPSAERPAEGDRLYEYIVRRLIDSWSMPAGIAQYYQWMVLPDADVDFDLLGHRTVATRGVGWRTVTVQWPQVREDLDRGSPVPLGIVTTASKDPQKLNLNHQVLAYGYDVSARRVTLRIYDPNRGGRDDVELRFDTSRPTERTAIDGNLGLRRRVRGFFRSAYQPKRPPAT